MQSLQQRHRLCPDRRHWLERWCPMSMGIRFTPFQIGTVRLLYATGMSSVRIGQQLGISDWTVKKYCKDIIRSKSEALVVAHRDVRQTKPKTKCGSRQKARRLIKAAGYLLVTSQHVHHKDGNPHNNNLDNLEIVDGVKHVQEHNPPKPDSPWLNELAHIKPEDRRLHMKDYSRIMNSRPHALAKRRERRRRQAAQVGWRNVK